MRCIQQPPSGFPVTTYPGAGYGEHAGSDHCEWNTVAPGSTRAGSGSVANSHPCVGAKYTVDGLPPDRTMPYRLDKGGTDSMANMSLPLQSAVVKSATLPPVSCVPRIEPVVTTIATSSPDT